MTIRGSRPGSDSAARVSLSGSRLQQENGVQENGDCLRNVFYFPVSSSFPTSELSIPPIPIPGKHNPTSEHSFGRPRICGNRRGSGNKALSQITGAARDLSI